MKKRSLLTVVMALAVGIVGAFGLTACDNRGPRSDQTVIKMMGWGDIYETRIFETMIDMFEDEHPEYYVEYNPIGGNDYMLKFMQAVQNRREMPDVFYMADYNFVRYMTDTDVFEDLTPYIESSPNLGKDDLYEESVYAYSYNKETKTFGDTENGGLYGLPKDLGPTVFIYNKDMAEDAGITVDRSAAKGYDPTTKKLNDQVPMTWAQYIAFASDISNSITSKHVYGGGSYPIELAYNVFGKNFTALDADGHSYIDVNNKEFAEALQFFSDIQNKNIFSSGKDKRSLVCSQEEQASVSGLNRFIAGEAATVFTGAWNTTSLWECIYDWDILPTPVPNESGDLKDVDSPAREGCESVSFLGSVCLSVYSGSKVKEGAYLLAEYLSTNVDAQRYNYKAGMAIPNLRTLEEEYLTAELNDPLGMNRPQNRQVYLNALKNSPRRAEAYTWDGEWTTEFFNCSSQNYKYSLQHVYRVDSIIDSYAPNYVVWDWDTKSITTSPTTNDSSASLAGVVSGQEFLSNFQSEIQKLIDENSDKYKFVVR